MEYYNIVNDTYRKACISQTLLPCVKLEFVDNYGRAYSDFTIDVSSENGGTISAAFGQGVQKSISLTIFDPTGKYIPNPNDRLFWIGRRFKVYLGLRIYKGIQLINDSLITTKNEYDIYWFTKGVYILTSISASHELGNQTISISGVDKFGYFTSATGYCDMLGNFVIPQGMTIQDAIISILNQDVGNGEIIDAVTPIIDSQYIDVRTPYEVGKSSGTYMGDIITELATMYRANVYYDNDGHFNFRRSMIGDQMYPIPIVWDFTDRDAEYLSSSLDYDLVNVVNCLYVVGENPSGDVTPKALRENTNAASPTNIKKLGRRAKLITSNTIRTDKEAEDYADYMLEQLCRVQQTLNFNITFLPHLELNQKITITDRFYHKEQEEFLIQSINYPIGVGTMSIGAVKIQELPTYMS